MCASKILVIFTGSIAAYKGCEVLSRLVQAGHSVRPVASASALRFIGAPTLEGLTGERVLADLFENGRAMDHIALTRWADAVVVCPCTAATLNRFAAGLADDLAGALFLARDPAKPWLVAPAMNPAMWRHPATVASVEKLRSWGLQFAPVEDGRVACGEEGEGRLAAPETVIAMLENLLARPPRRLKVLVTSGGTSEPIDGVRVLTNTSSGRTGAQIAQHFVRAGHDVHLLRARTAPLAPGARDESFSTFRELDLALEHALTRGHFDAVIHAAAVSDYSVKACRVDGREIGRGSKLRSGQSLQLELQPLPKLVDTLRARSRNPAMQVVAFKLTSGATPAESAAAIAALFDGSSPDLVVHNDLALAADPERFPATIHSRNGSAPLPCATRSALAENLERVLLSDESNPHAPLSRHR